MRKKLKKALGLFSISICCLGVFFLTFSFDKAFSGNEEIAASVNGKVITRAELDREIINLSHRYSIQTNDSNIPNDIEKKALDNLIAKQLLFEASQKAQIKIDETDVDKNLQQAISRFPSKEAFESVLEREKVTEEQLKSEIRYGLAIQTYVEDKFISKTTVSDEELKTFYEANPSFFKHPEMVKASHIFIRVDPQADTSQKAEARRKIDEIEKKLMAGEDFAELAKVHSECPSSSKGGDLGFFEKGQMDKSFEDSAFSLKPGETSPVVESSFGYHIIKVLEKKPEGSYSLDQVKPQIQEAITREKVQKLLEKDIEDLKSQAKIETFETEQVKPKN